MPWPAFALPFPPMSVVYIGTVAMLTRDCIASVSLCKFDKRDAVARSYKKSSWADSLMAFGVLIRDLNDVICNFYRAAAVVVHQWARVRARWRSRARARARGRARARRVWRARALSTAAARSSGPRRMRRSPAATRRRSRSPTQRHPAPIRRTR